MLFLYQDPFMLSMTHQIFQEVLVEYADIFDMYLCDDASQLHDVFYLKDTHPQLPFIRIIDPAKRVPIDQIKQVKSIFSDKFNKEKETESKKAPSAGDYAFKQEIMFMPVHHQPVKFKEQIEQFLDGTNKNGDSL